MTVSVDDVLIQIGECGRFQKRIYFILLTTWIFCFPYFLLSVFVLAVPEHRCRIPGIVNDTFEIQDDFHRSLVNRYIPKSEDETKPYDECHLYSSINSYTGSDNGSLPSNTSLMKCQSWIYSKDVFDTTFVTENNLVCDSKYKLPIAKTFYFTGLLAGSLLLGVLSDVMGRRKCLLLCTSLLFGVTLALSWAPDYLSYVILRFFSGFFNVGMFMTAFVAGMEIIGPNRRAVVSILMPLFSTIGALYLAIVSYSLRNWNLTGIAISIPIALLVPVLWFVPESPRWLVSQNRMEEAKDILQKIAKGNKKPFSPETVVSMSVEKSSNKGKIWLLFTSRGLFVRTTIIFYNWLVASMTFYGLSLNTGHLYGDYYLNFVIVCLVEIPGHVITMLTINRFGRRKMLFLFWIFGGTACISTIFTVTFGGKELQSLTTALAMIGKLFSAAAFDTLYVYSAELFPTVVRNAGMGGSSASSRIGGIISPFVADSASLVGGHLGKAVPLIVFGSAAILAGFLTLLLPETLNRKLPETIKDGKEFGKLENIGHS